MKKLEITDKTTRIERRLIEAGMTRAELSRQSGVPIRTLESWANGSRIPRDVYVLRKIAKVFNCQIEDLIEPEDPDRDHTFDHTSS